MGKLRLNLSMRSALHSLAQKLVECPAEKSALASAYVTAANLVCKTVESVLPPSDMKILRKYDCAAIADCIRLQLAAGGIVRFDFNKNTGPLSIGRRIFLADVPTTVAYNVWDAANSAHQEALNAKLSDYHALINSCAYYEDAVAVWPEAEQLRAQFGQGALIAFSPDVVARIRADVATRVSA